MKFLGFVGLARRIYPSKSGVIRTKNHLRVNRGTTGFPKNKCSIFAGRCDPLLTGCMREMVWLLRLEALQGDGFRRA